MNYLTVLCSVLLFIFGLSSGSCLFFLILLEQLVNFVYDWKMFRSVDRSSGLVGSATIWLPRHLTCFGCSTRHVFLRYLVQAQVQEGAWFHYVNGRAWQRFNSAFFQLLVWETQFVGGRHTYPCIEAIPVFSRVLLDNLGPRCRNQVSLNVGLLELALRVAIVEELGGRGLLPLFVPSWTDRAVMELVHHLAHLIILGWLVV